MRDELLEAVGDVVARADYDSQLRDLYALVSKRAALVTQKSEEELANNEEYQELEDRIEALQTDLDRTAMEMEGDDFEVAFRNLSED